jgi:hypothetical protein
MSCKKKLLSVWNWKSFLQLFSKLILKLAISFMNRKSSCGYATHFFYMTFFPNRKFQLICIKIAILILSAILFICSNLFFIILNDLNYQNISLNLIVIGKIFEMWWNMIKKNLIWENPNPCSISELINNVSKNPNVWLYKLIIKLSPKRIRNLRIVGSKMGNYKAQTDG